MRLCSQIAVLFFRSRRSKKFSAIDDRYRSLLAVRKVARRRLTAHLIRSVALFRWRRSQRAFARRSRVALVARQSAADARQQRPLGARHNRRLAFARDAHRHDERRRRHGGRHEKT